MITFPPKVFLDKSFLQSSGRDNCLYFVEQANHFLYCKFFRSKKMISGKFRFDRKKSGFFFGRFSDLKISKNSRFFSIENNIENQKKIEIFKISKFSIFNTIFNGKIPKIFSRFSRFSKFLEFRNFLENQEFSTFFDDFFCKVL